MFDSHKASLATVVAIEEERRDHERAHGTPTSYNDWPRDLLVRWRGAAAQLRIHRSFMRLRGFQPPDLVPDLTWIDDRWIELKIDDRTGLVHGVQTPEPEASL